MDSSVIKRDKHIGESVGWEQRGVRINLGWIKIELPIILPLRNI